MMRRGSKVFKYVNTTSLDGFVSVYDLISDLGYEVSGVIKSKLNYIITTCVNLCVALTDDGFRKCVKSCRSWVEKEVMDRCVKGECDYDFLNKTLDYLNDIIGSIETVALTYSNRTNLV